MIKPLKRKPLPPRQKINDANHAIAMLNTVQHWSSTRVYSDDGKRCYRVVITTGGHCALAQRSTFVGAVQAALHLLHGKRKSKSKR